MDHSAPSGLVVFYRPEFVLVLCKGFRTILNNNHLQDVKHSGFRAVLETDTEV